MTNIRSITREVADTLARIAGLNPALNAYITVFEDEALAQARQLEADERQGRVRGPLHGRVMSVKDLIDVAGVPTTAASRTRAGHVARTDADLVARMRQAGAIVIGKTNLHELALGTTSDESAFGPVHHPRDPQRSPGGSSGGSAAAVAAGLCWASIGTDTGGSVRIPAAACGVVGLKPTFGEIPMTGVVPLSVSLDHAGPLTSSVGDAWLVYAVLANRVGPADTTRQVATLRLGMLGGYFLEKLDETIRATYEQAVGHLRVSGASVRGVMLGRGPDIATTYSNIVLPEAAAYHTRSLDTAPDAFALGIRARLEAGRHIPHADYVEAQRSRVIFRELVDTALGDFDALVLPALAVCAPRIGAVDVPLSSGPEPLRSLMLRLTQLFNLTGHPAISIPCGDTPDGLPCGLQLVGRRNQTDELLRTALACEACLARQLPIGSST